MHHTVDAAMHRDDMQRYTEPKRSEMSHEPTSETGARAVRVAVPSEYPGGLTAPRSGHFGRADCFTIVEINGDQVGEVTVLQNMPHTEGGCMAPVMLLAQQGVNAIVVDGIGGRPLAGFNQVGIAVHAGSGQTVEHSVRAFALDLLPSVDPGSTCHH
jgi:predicted Fe-Mo cluster-binding NifX family protein